ncbi:hypothetical protein XM38_028430 [Halomicronema hongdechloris C2206]|uniref:DUF6603 domain-containing protein n=1 Tax=Halomicronema hongdechloris C2206 TaxID=1641165 RepID=A0A1Z3HNM3_9CYAN|nr:DUF6603 domain-containing protein [Halomicronema hongdechloris]ASC71889.1 hypothetical protein XM38_028430 [Halomicronema hongdechloris C2206]
MATPGTLESIAIWLAKLFQPLQEELQVGRIRFFFAELGMEFPPELETKAAFTRVLGKAVTRAAQLPRQVTDLIQAIEAEDLSKITNLGVDLFGTIKSLVESFQSIADELKNLGGSLPGISAAELNAFANELPQNIFDYLVIKTLEGTPGMAEIFEFIDAIERQENISGDFTYTSRKIKLNQFTHFISRPGEHLENLYDWGRSSFDGIRLLSTLEKLLNRSGVPAIFDQTAATPVLDLIYLEAKPETNINPKGLELSLLDRIIVDSEEYGLDDWIIRFISNTDLVPGVEIIIQPDGKVAFIPPSGQLKGESFLEWIGGDKNGDPYLILGRPGGSRLEATQLSMRAGIGFAWDPSANRAIGDFTIGGEVKGGKLLIDFSQGDGFLTRILSNIKLESNFDLGFGFSGPDGIFFYGSSSLLVQLPAHIDLGVVKVKAITIGVGIDASEIPISLSADINANFGPLIAAIEQIGMRADLSFPANQNGNLGPVDLDIGFNPPKGVGLAVDAGVIRGGGFLRFYPEKEQYDGILSLELIGIVSVTAIGLITTRLPDGSKGFSLLLILSAEFGSGFQLGYGFVLLGVGGLLGLNRTMKPEPLTEGIRTGATESIMFPRNVIVNAPRIISDLRQFFPPEEGIFLIGPMVKLGWGTPALITFTLGIIFEIPGNIAILGILKVALPDERVPLLVLKVLFIGVLEFDKQRAYFFASLFESRILFITLEGEMGLLIAWGNDSNFVVSVGGFHPQFTPPPLPFPTPKRVSLNILNESWGRIRVMNYFAITSNTVQLGARAELFFGFKVFNLEGHCGFDALFQFNPFFFIIEISCGVSLKVFGIGLFSIELRFSLEGPTPWRAKGYGKLKLLFFTIKANFDFTWGEKKDTSLPPIEVLPLLQGQLQQLANWQVRLPTSSNLPVSLRKREEDNESLVLPPAGTLMVTQRAVPLGIRLDKVGSQKPSDGKRFYLEVVGGLKKVKDLTEQFAIAQFQDFKDDEKLSQAAFQPEDAGLELAVSDRSLATGKAVKRNIRWETHIIDTNSLFALIALLGLVSRLFNLFLNGSVITKSVVSLHYKRQFQPFDEKITLRPEQFVVASTVDNKAISQQAIFTSEAKAREFMQAEVAKDATRRELLHVILSDEVNIDA